MDLLTYLKNYEPYELVHFSGNTYTTKTHDSLKISNGKWMWWKGRKHFLDIITEYRYNKRKNSGGKEYGIKRIVENA